MTNLKRFLTLAGFVLLTAVALYSSAGQFAYFFGLSPSKISSAPKVKEGHFAQPYVLAFEQCLVAGKLKDADHIEKCDKMFFEQPSIAACKERKSFYSSESYPVKKSWLGQQVADEPVQTTEPTCFDAKTGLAVGA